MSPTAQSFAGVLSALVVLVVGAAGCTNVRDGDRPASLWHPEPWVTGCVTDPTCDVPLVTAHRGLGADEPENTVAGIRSLAMRGAD
ncbi:MAG: hypothetical protein V3T05_08005, partial [Myxococcota bacterium]